MPLASTALAVSVVDDPAGRAVGRLVGEDPVDRSGALQACGRVDDVAGGHSLAGLRACVETDQRLAGRDRDPHLDVVLLDRPVADGEAGADGAFGVVLVRVGAPKSAITASPMNFSTVPP